MLRCASMFTGLGPERKALVLSSLAAVFPFAVEIKDSAIRFLLDNGDVAYEHVFNDVRAFMDASDGTSDWCHTHMKVCHCLVRKRELDILIAGISCKPFSLARAGRMAGTQTHAEFDHMESFILALLRFEPAVGILENVLGFLQKCKLLGKTPLDNFFDNCREKRRL